MPAIYGLQQATPLRLLSVFMREQGCAGARVLELDGMRWMAADQVADIVNWTHQSGWLPADIRQMWMDRCVRQISWDQPEVHVYGRWHRVPRLTAFMADRQVSYRYSGAVHQGEGWPDWFLPLLKLVSSQSAAPFNGCLFNLYRDGQDRMGWHADDEPEIDASFPIASLSLGSSRDLQFRHRFSNSRCDVTLADGDLLLMDPDCQKLWMHGLPVRKRVKQPRLNLTFRVFRSWN